jgi:dsRNA-specific ribonuclease
MSDTEIKIIKGTRGEGFKQFLFRILRRSRMQSNTIHSILDDYGMELFNTAFTHKTADEENNYEYLELLGDGIVNTCIVWYINDKFPKLRKPEFVKIVARLKINLISKKSFSEFAARLKMWEYVTASEDVKTTKMKKTLEDVFEAFFGAVCTLVNNKNGMGFNVCKNIIISLFDQIKISLKYEDLYDAKTRLKETFDLYKDLGVIQYENERVDDIQYVSVYMNKNGFKTKLGRGSAALKIDAEQKASDYALKTLAHQYNVRKPVPEIFNKLL